MGNLDAPAGIDAAVDHRLVERARAGDAHAFALLVREHHVAALRCARANTRTASDAEEAVQEALVKAWSALPRFRPGAPFAPWFLAIVANEARSRTRAEQRRDAWTAALAREPLAERDPAPEDEVLAAERRAVLAGALGSLPARDREALGLRYAAGLSERETAMALDVRPGTVKSRVSRALGRLRTDPSLRAGVLGGAVAAVLGGLAAVPDTRAGLLELLGLRGGEQVVRVTDVPSAPGVAPAPGRPVTAAGAARLLGRPPLVLPGQGPLGRDGDALVSAAAGATLTQRRGGTAYARKEVGPGTEVREVVVSGAPGLLLTGAPFTLAPLGPDGTLSDAGRRRVTGAVVLWERDGVALRLEHPGSAQQALAAARSVRSPR